MICELGVQHNNNLSISERLLSGIKQMKHILGTRVTNPQNNADWSSKLTDIVNTATGKF